MQTSTLITLSPDDLSNLITEAVKKAIRQLDNRAKQSVYSVADIAKDSGFSVETVRLWITIGRTAPGGRRVKLKIMDGLAETYRVRWEAYREFLNAFPDIACPSKR